MSDDRTKMVGAAIQQMSNQQVHCRDYGHSWAPHRAERLKGSRGFEQQLLCQRCGTMRVRLLDRYGDVLRSAYRYPEGYLVPGLGRLSGEDRGQLRIASILDSLIKGNANA